ncbi:MAG: Tn3 family transposase [gamma proteobacterium symbiont of Bathyaustriella thionipta]|nr:Tn3 family transposase [gamma proteobacterium symbiont of Bathyaustriella thionipta]MCU7950471.1 Tn3 family transposase [gamma proteobacterium symbiont of Bathyaustriella thionipta]MCU7954663.1 Tn3 family transposase [gamma proteobacterium symbiont of Bathyaustriella thionipta]MCU7957803.1 Tn3 family transposase [gamma proteobacterium symbiont of Bathyaustriella thionipta]
MLKKTYQALFYSTVFGTFNRKAAYVIVSLINNNDVQHKSIHSTDTYGFIEQIFATAHFINDDFVPPPSPIQKLSISKDFSVAQTELSCKCEF